MKRATTKLSPRRTSFAVSSLPRYYCGGSPLATHLCNALNAMMRPGETFVARAAKAYVPVLKQSDPELCALVEGFAAQEARHSFEHLRLLRALADEGHDIGSVVRLVDDVGLKWADRVTSSELRLAIAVGTEHIAATLANYMFEHEALGRQIFSDGVRELMAWHAAEEIEHRSVLFDVLAHVNSSYGLRITGLALAVVFWVVGVSSLTTVLALGDRRLGPARILRDLAAAPAHGSGAVRHFVRAMRAYARRDFHPSREDTYHERALAFLQNTPGSIAAA